MRVVLITILLSVITAGAARATVVLPADLSELSHDAVAIARGRVVAVEPQWKEGRRGIETLVTLETETYLKGSLGDVVQFRVPGGSLGRFSSIVVGAPQFTVGQRVILFLGSRGPSVPYVLGLSQGVFRIARAADNSGWVVMPPTLWPATAGDVRVVRGETSRRPVRLDDFEQRIRVLAGGAK